ncbi:hypothetical protein GIB67_009066, partial [Kingdonia uniflora]
AGPPSLIGQHRGVLFYKIGLRYKIPRQALGEEKAIAYCTKVKQLYDGDSTIGHRLSKEITKVEFVKMKGKERLTQPTNSYQWETLATNLEEFKQIFVAREEAWAKVFALELD